MSGPMGIPVEASPYDMVANIMRDGKPRDAINQKVRINDVVRIWTAQNGWGYDRDFFVKHIMPKWSVSGRYMGYSYLLVPQLDDIDDANNAAYTGGDQIDITKNTVLLLTVQNFIAIRKGMAQENLRVICDDFQLVRLKVGENGVIYNSDEGADVTGWTK
jgi:hypothetical protein